MIVLAGAGSVQSQSLETMRFKVTLHPGGALEVQDKAAGVTWKQPSSDVQISDVDVDGNVLQYRVNGDVSVSARVEENTISLDISGDPNISIDGLEYPPGFVLQQSPRQRLLLPNCAGLSIPFAMKDEPTLQRVEGYYNANISQTGLMMPWLGVTDGKAGCLMMLTTPFDARMKVEKDDSGYQTRVAWWDEKGQMGYDRGVRYYFADAGGYVALCKMYRQYAIHEGLFVSLSEKRKTVPTLDRFVGGMNLWVVEWPDMALFEDMHDAGMDKLLVNYHVTKTPEGIETRPGRNNVYEPMDRTFIDQLHKLGYLAGRYDYYRTIFPPSRTNEETWIMRRTGYPEQCAVDAKGNIVAGFMGRPGDTEILGHRCSWRQFEMARIYIPLDIDRAGYDGRLIDAMGAVDWKECYSPFHPVTRRGDAEYRKKLLSLVRDLGQITGTEHMASWAVPVCHYAEAPTTFVRFFRGPRANRLTTVPLEVPDSYQKVVLNPQLRVPLWQLVFHDAMVITNRWNWSANRYTDQRIWEREDLMNLLHGQMPTMLLNHENFKKNRERFVQTYKAVCDWNAATGFEEMTDHRWVSEDGQVQQTTYASGATVVVNFSDSEFKMPDGARVPARGFLKQGMIGQ